MSTAISTAISMAVPTAIQSRLAAFCEQQQIRDHHFGSICTLIYITRQAKLFGLPLRVDRLASRRGGQVAGLYPEAVHAILDDYGVVHEMLGEAGRTNPGSLAHATAYASFLNQWPDLDRQSLSAIERWWVQRLPPRPDAGALRLHWRPNGSVRWAVAGLLAQINRRAPRGQAVAQQKIWLAGMAAALLTLPLPVGKEQEPPCIEIINDSGDLQVTCAHSIVFATYFPGSALLDTLRFHLRRRKRKLIVTLDQHTPVINQVLDEAGLSRFVEVLGIEQWLAVYIHGAADHSTDGQQHRVEEVVERYRQLRDSFLALPKLVLRVK